MKNFVGLFLILTLIISSFLTSCTLSSEQPITQPDGDNEESEAPLIYSEGLEYELNDDGESYSVVGFGAWQGLKLVIPNEYNGLPVTAIGDGAFCDDYYLRPVSSWEEFDKREHSVMITKVVIPESVTTIGDFAFFNCISLCDVTIPSSVQTIGAYSFFGCLSLCDITIPDSVQTIGLLAFAACKSLNNIRIPKSVTSIEEGALTGCISLGKIDVDENNQYYTSISNNLYSKDGKTLIQYALGQKNEIFTIPNNVEFINANAFMFCNTIKQINIPSSMTKIGEASFGGCYSLSAVNIPTSVQSIENGAFADCYSLTTITIPQSVTYVSESAFDSCYSLVEIYNKSSVDIRFNCHIINNESDSYIKYVEDFVFYDDGINVYLVKYIGDETEITLPQYGASKQYGIYDYAFYDTVSDINKPIAFQIMAGGNSVITSVTIPDCVVSIGRYAFSGCSLQDSVIIPNSVEHIGADAFLGCSSITIYCEAKSAPGGWNTSWNVYRHNPSNETFIPTIWGYVN